MEPQPEPEARADRQVNLRDVSYERGILENIGSRIVLNDRVRLGEALGRHFKDYRLGAKHAAAAAAIPRIQSFMRAPVIQNTVERNRSTLDLFQSVVPTGRTEAQMRAMRRRINEFNEPGGRGIAQLRTRGGARIDRGRGPAPG